MELSHNDRVLSTFNRLKDGSDRAGEPKTRGNPVRANLTRSCLSRTQLFDREVLHYNEQGIYQASCRLLAPLLEQGEQEEVGCSCADSNDSLSL